MATSNAQAPSLVIENDQLYIVRDFLDYTPLRVVCINSKISGECYLSNTGEQWTVRGESVELLDDSDCPRYELVTASVVKNDIRTDDPSCWARSVASLIALMEFDLARNSFFVREESGSYSLIGPSGKPIDNRTFKQREEAVRECHHILMEMQVSID